jgi:hypothetical protein
VVVGKHHTLHLAGFFRYLGRCPQLLHITATVAMKTPYAVLHYWSPFHRIFRKVITAKFTGAFSQASSEMLSQQRYTCTPVSHSEVVLSFFPALLFQTVVILPGIIWKSCGQSLSG